MEKFNVNNYYQQINKTQNTIYPGTVITNTPDSASMFQQTLSQYQSKPNPGSTHTTVLSNPSTSTDFDLQYELYSRYIHISKEQLAIQELILMNDSQSLLESINLTSKADTSRDVHSTMDSMSYDEDFENGLVHDLSAIEKRSPKKITRKSTHQSILKPIGRGGEDFAEILNEIQRNCTDNTFTTIKAFFQQHKKNLTKIAEVEKKQKNMRRLEEKTEKLEQQNAIFKVKLGEVEDKIRAKDDEIKGLKEKLNQLRTTEKQNVRAQKRLLSPATKSTEESGQSPTCLNPVLSQYLHQKQSQLSQRMVKVQQIEVRIQHLIESAVVSEDENNDPCCQRCCSMIRKVKESVMQYRQYLQEEGEACERLYNMLKAEVQHCLTDRKIQIPNV